MLKELIQSQISVKELTYKPGEDPVSFGVQVVNTSDRFASFQVEIIPAGSDAQDGASWYRISPDISSKMPPGTTTEFQVTIFDTPTPGFIGQMNLTVRIFAMELGDESRQLVRLILQKGSRVVPLKVKLPIDKFQALPREEVPIPVRIINPGQTLVKTIVTLKGINPTWFGDAIEKQVMLQPGKETEIRFICTIPFGPNAPSQAYPFTIEAQVIDGELSIGKGSLEILPMGNTDFTCEQVDRYLPPRRRQWFRRTTSVNYPLTLQNASNLQQQVTLAIQNTSIPESAILINPTTIDLGPQETQPVIVTVTQRRPIIGRTKAFTLQTQSTWSDRRVDIQHETLELKLKIHPIILIWWIVSVAVFVVPPILWWFSCLNPGNRSCGHLESVNTVQLSGNGNRAISGSGDQTMREWDIAGFTNPIINQEIGIIARLGKAVRVLRYKPANNDQLAVGLENGEIQLWDMLKKSDKPKISFGQQRDDRVLDLRFTPDSKSLISAHGSGQIFRWDLDQTQSGTQDKPNNKLQLEFAIYSTAIVGDGQTLAIGGKFNRLELWNWQTGQHRSIPYIKPGGQYDYIQALATADYQPQTMASGDTEGNIVLWDMKTCSVDPKQPCRVVDQWTNAHGSSPVKSVALSRNACYLVSGGGDGRVMLWPLTADGRRASQHLAGIPVDKSFEPKFAIQSVDIKVLQDKMILLSGSEDTQIRAETIAKPSQLECDRE
jgi:WD40 repeat protein